MISGGPPGGRVGDPIRILVCDDHVVFAESLAHLLESAGHDVVGVTHHPDVALAVLRRTPVDICLLDVMFGADNAVTRMADIRSVSPRTRTVMLSGQIDDALVKAGQAAGVRGFTDKRQPAVEILAIIERVHTGETVLPGRDTLRPPVHAVRLRAANDVQRLASYLTPREREVLSKLVLGHDTTKIARGLGIAGATARCHVQSVLTKIGAHSRLEAATTAVRHGMVDPETGEWLMQSA
jgi:two-component system nitrate/nitrite response regulator NarL